MNRNVKTKERIIRYLLGIDRKYANNQLSVDVGRKSFSNSKIADIGEEEFIKQISLLETDGLIEVKFRTGYRDLTYSITIVLLSGILNYFDDKRRIKTSKRNEWIKFCIPVSISIIALVISGIALLLELRVIEPMQQPKPELETTDVFQPNDSLDQ